MTTQTETKYFDLHTTGIGYLNRFRQVKPNQGQSFYSCTIAALRGNTDNTLYTYFDVRIVNEEALNVLLNCMDETDKDTKVLVGFKIGDIYPEPFTYQSGNKQGQTGVMLKGRLIKLNWLKINNELVYKPQPLSAVEQKQEQQSDIQNNQSVDQSAPPVMDNSSVMIQDQDKFSEVFLSKEDPDFLAKKETLKQQGYRWNNERKSWQKPMAA